MVIIIVTHSFTMEKKFIHSFIHSSINQSIIRIHFNIYADTSDYCYAKIITKMFSFFSFFVLLNRMAS